LALLGGIADPAGLRQAPSSTGGPPSHPGQGDNVPPLTGSPRQARRIMSSELIKVRKRRS
jgi:hypothetical protein